MENVDPEIQCIAAIPFTELPFLLIFPNCPIVMTAFGWPLLEPVTRVKRNEMELLQYSAPDEVLSEQIIISLWSLSVQMCPPFGSKKSSEELCVCEEKETRYILIQTLKCTIIPCFSFSVNYQFVLNAQVVHNSGNILRNTYL